MPSGYSPQCLDSGDEVPHVMARTGPTLQFVFAVSFLFCAFLFIALLVPPVRNWFFATSLCPFPLPGEITAKQIEELKSRARPGDVIVESNMHYWQWVALCRLATGSSWVHASLVDDQGSLLTVSGKAVQLPVTVFLSWRSTRLALVRPPYKDSEAVAMAIQYARSRLNTPYDPSFRDPAGSCTGLVGEALARGGVDVPRMHPLNYTVYGASSFLTASGFRIIWRTDDQR